MQLSEAVVYLELFQYLYMYMYLHCGSYMYVSSSIIHENCMYSVHVTGWVMLLIQYTVHVHLL